MKQKRRGPRGTMGSPEIDPLFSKSIEKKTKNNYQIKCTEEDFHHLPKPAETLT